MTTTNSGRDSTGRPDGRQLEADAADPIAVVTFEVDPGFALSSEFTVSKVEGLLECDVVRFEKTARLVTFWRSRDSALIHVPDLQREAKVTTPFEWGAVAQSAFPTRSRSWWETAKTIAAAFGTVAALYGGASYLFAPPHITMYIPSATIDASVNRPFTIPVVLTNESRFDTAQAIIADVIFPDGEGSADPSRSVITVNPGTNHEIRVSATMPKPEDAVVNVAVDTWSGRRRAEDVGVRHVAASTWRDRLRTKVAPSHQGRSR
jgi:hypothetical protein